MGKPVRTMVPGARIVTPLGHKGVLVAVERVWLTVVFDDQPERQHCFHAFDKWIQVAADDAIVEKGDAVKHTCHALGCKRPCQPRRLMCRECWSLVPVDIGTEVCRTVGLRGPVVDATWAPWWRAQAKAIAHVAFLKEPNVARWDRYLKRALAFADRLESEVGTEHR